MSTLFGTKIKDTYDGLLKVSDNVGITSTKKIITDGLGNDSSVYISSEDFQISTFFYVDINSGTPTTSKIGLGTSSPTTTLHIVGDLRLTARFYDSNNSTGTSNQVLSSTGSGTDWVTLSEIGGVDGTGVANKLAYWLDTETITYDNLLHWDSSNNRLGVGTATPQTKLEVNGSFRVSSGNEKYLDIDDGGYVYKFGDIDGGEGNSYLEIDSNNSETNLYKSTLGIPTYIFHQGNTTTKFGFSTTDTFVVRTNDVERFSVNNSGVALAGGSRVTTILDEDDMASDSNTSLATQQSIKAFVESEIASVPSGLNFQGNWNADTNSPTLASGTGTVGHFYNVSTPGSTNLDGETDWKTGDWAVFVEAGGTDKWMKIDNTSVLSGVGSANKIAYWSNDSTLTYDTDFYVDGDTIFTTNLEASGTGNFDSGKVIIDNISGYGRIHGTSSVFLGGVSTTLVQLSAKLIPDADSTRDLGTTTRYWKDAYIDTITTTGSVTFGGNTEVQNSQLKVRDTSTNHQLTLQSSVGGNARIKAHKDNLGTDQNLDIKATQIDLYSGSISGSTNVSTLLLDSSNNATFAGNITTGGDSSVLGGSGTVPLYVRSTGTVSYVQIQTSTTGSNTTGDGLTVGVNGSTAYVWQRENASLHLGTNDSSALTINSSGNVGIGTTSPTGKLNIVQSSTTNPALRLTDDGVASYDFTFPDTSTIQLGTNTTSDKTLKLVNAGSGNFNISVDNATLKSTAPELLFSETGSGTSNRIYADGGNFHIDLDNTANDSGQLKLLHQGTQFAVFKGSTGALGIGTTSPNDKLEVSDTTAPNIRMYRSGTGQVWQHTIDSSGRYMLREAASSGGTLYTRFQVDDTGEVAFPSYGSGTFTGTATQRLAVDSSGNIIELPIGSGAVDGSGTANYITKWTDSDTIGDSIISSSGTNVTIATNNDYPILQLLRDGDNPSTNQLLGRIQFMADYDGSHQNWGRIELDTNASATRTDMDFYVKSTGGSELLTMKLNGTAGDGGNVIVYNKLGIGTTSPSYPVHIYSGGSERFAVSGDVFVRGATDLKITGTSRRLSFDSGTGTIRTSTSNNLILQTNSTTALTIDSSQNATFTGTITSGNITTNSRITFDYGGDHYLEAGTNSLAFKTSGGSTVALIDYANSRVGIGTTSPTQMLHVLGGDENTMKLDASTGQPALFFAQSGTNRWEMRADSSHYGLYSYGTSTWEFYILNGNTGIGTNSPSEKLSVSGNIESLDTFILKNGSGNKWQMLFDSNNFNLRYYNGSSWSADAFAIDTSNNATFAGQVNVAERIHIGGATSGTKTLSFESTTNAQNYDIDYYNNAGNDTIQGKIRYLEGAGSIELHPNWGAGAALTVDWSNNATFAGNVTTTGVAYTDYVQTRSGTSIDFRHQDASVIMRIDTDDARVGIGTTSPGQKLEVAGRIRVTTDPTIEFYEASNKRGGIQWDITNDYTNIFAVGGDIRFDIGGEKMRITSTGSLKLNTYGSGTFTGTATQRLAVDSSGNIIEVPIGSGAVDGSGTANRLAIWSDTDTLTSNVNIVVDGGELQLGNGLLVEDNDTSVITAKAYEPHIIWQKTRGSGGDDYFKIKHENDASAVDFSLAQNGGSDVRIMRINNNNRVIVGGYNEYNASTLNVEGTFGVSTTSKFGGNAIFVSKIGIGTTSPSKQLMLYGNTPFIRLEDDQGGNKRLDLWVDSNAVAHIDANQSASQITLRTASTDRLRITNAGNVGIGTTSPAEKLEVSGGHIKITNAGNTNLYINANNSGSDASIFFEELDSVKAKIQYDASNDSMLFTDGSYTDTMTLKGGKVGIGTTSPNRLLTVGGTSQFNDTAYFTTRGLISWGSMGGGTGFGIRAESGNALSLGANGTWDYLIIDTSGNATFDGDITSGGNIITETTSGNKGIKVITADDAEGFLIFGDADDNSMGGMAYNNATNSLDIDCNNGVALSFDSSRNSIFYGSVTLTPASGHSYFGSGTSKDLNINAGSGLVYFNNSGTTTFAGSVHLDNDSAQLQLGDDNDLQLYHDGTDSLIRNTTTGNLYIENQVDDKDIIFKADDGSGGTATYFYVDGGNEAVRFSKDSWHNDDVKAMFGTGTDLQIYHDGTHSYIDDVGTGSLYIKGGSSVQIESNTGENMIVCSTNAAVELYYNNSKKLETNSDGVSATGYYDFESTGSGYGFKYGVSPGTTQGIAIKTSDTGGAYFDGVGYFWNENTGNGANMFQMQNDGDTYCRYINFFRGGNTSDDIIGWIGYNSTNTATTYSTSSSDERLKKNIVDWDEEVLPKFLALEPKQFHFNKQDDSEEKNKGYIAQQEVDNFPEVYQLNGEGDDARYGFHPMEMTPYLMKAIKELVEKNKELEARLEALEK